MYKVFDTYTKAYAQRKQTKKTPKCARQVQTQQSVLMKCLISMVLGCIPPTPSLAHLTRSFFPSLSHGPEESPRFPALHHTANGSELQGESYTLQPLANLHLHPEGANVSSRCALASIVLTFGPSTGPPAQKPVTQTAPSITHALHTHTEQSVQTLLCQERLQTVSQRQTKLNPVNMLVSPTLIVLLGQICHAFRKK